MAMIAPGVYSDDGEKSYEVESSYYLNFQIISALFSIEKIERRTPVDFGILQNKYQYYHYYSDHLIFSTGQISNRFDVKDEDKGIVFERKKANIHNFVFSKEKYPILSNKKMRNTIEHIDEHDQKIIKKYRGVGGFNLIDGDTDEKVIDALTKDRKSHPYTLDITSNTILIMRNDTELNLNINDLKKELFELQKSAKSLLNFATEEF